MIVAYDFRFASDHFAGIGTYAFAVIRELLELPGDERYVILWNPESRQSRFDLTPLRSHPRVEWVERPFHPVHPLGAAQVGSWLRSLRPAVYFSPFSIRPIGSGCAEVITVHDVAKLRLLPAYKNILYMISLKLALGARFILTVSEFSRREIITLVGAREDRIRAILPGVAPWPEGTVPRRPAALEEGRFALLVGDNRPHKNLDVVVRAWAAMGNEPPLPLVAAGPTIQRFTSLEDMVQKSGARRVRHLGWMDPAELAWLYENAEMLLFPSVYEGFGSPLAEGLAHGLPVLASDIPAFHEVGAGAAIYVDPRDPAAWTREALRVAASADVRERQRPIARARAAELTYKKTAEGVLEVLREAARQKR